MRVLSSSQYKNTTFFAQIQILLTFRNTLATVKMRRFAADRVWQVLYYEEAVAGCAVLAAKGMLEDGGPIDFGLLVKTILQQNRKLLFIEPTL